MEIKKEITNSELAVAINNIADRFDKLDSKVDNRINELAEAISKLDSKVDNKINKLDGNRIDELAEMTQRGFVALEDKFDDKFNRLNNKVDESQQETNKRFERVDERFRQSLGVQDKISNSLVKLETDNAIGAGVSRRQTDQLEDHEERIVVTEQQLGIPSAL